ncbi:MAG: nucleoside hydrolase-like domain-containing protein [Bacteroidota bacterium]
MNLRLLLLLCLLLPLSESYALWAQDKTRILVLTDIENEPDDAQSMVRFLTYANQFEIEGLIATTSCWQRDKIADWRIHEIVDAYGKVRDQLELHERGYPTHASLKALIKKGLPKFGMAGVGLGQDSEGSDWVIKVLGREDDRPLWITAWGGANILAQALWRLKREKSPEELANIIARLRVYTISDQDDSGPWIRKTFPNLFYIVTPGKEERVDRRGGGGAYHYATWSGISGDRFHGRFMGADFSIVDNPWLDKHIRNGHGPLGKEYPQTEYLMEGDTPSFLGLINNGLNNMEHPNYGSWGGRYESYLPHTLKHFYEAESRPIWTNVVDEVYSELTQRNHTSHHATIWRWRKAYQHDFAARMDWCVRPYEEANHPPMVKLAHEPKLTVKEGEKVALKAGDCSDPDGDDLSYRWIYYHEVGTLAQYELEMHGVDSKTLSFIAPRVKEAQSMHFILELEDMGTPSLIRYKRVILTVIPE